MNYYNEHEPSAASWLRELIAAGVIPPGEVDVRSIVDVSANDLKPYAQCHFFAGIGGWSYALQLAGWPVERPVWTGSCPCQPFSAAGQGMGKADPRHLWPVFRNLIGQCRPPVVFGEQVASIAGLRWFDGVCADMEAAGYAVGSSDLCAASVGAPHIRQRLFWVADAASERWNGRAKVQGTNGRAIDETSRGLVLTNGARRNTRKQTAATVGHGSAALATSGDGRMADADGGESGHGELQPGGRLVQQPENETALRMEHAARNGRKQRRAEPSGRSAVSGCGSGGMGNAASEQARIPGLAWGQSDAVACADGKARRVESGTFPLAHGVPGRVGLLRGYGNAIVPQVAARFVEAWVYSANDQALPQGGAKKGNDEL